jgi:hypothetical protein
MLLAAQFLCAEGKPIPEPDVLVLSNGDTLHGKLVSAVAGKVTFHSDALGDVSLGWDKIKELHTSRKFAVLDKNAKPHGHRGAEEIPFGTVDMTEKALTVHLSTAAQVPPIPVTNAQYVVDDATLKKQLSQEPRFLEGWNGAATAGATLVAATENQYTVSGGINLVRLVPTVGWLPARNRTTADFTGSYGKITQPAYFSAGTQFPEQITKSAISHGDAERDQYFSPRFFALGQTAFDHNFGQDLQLQQIYGVGIGWTAIKMPKFQADLKGSMQYEKQQFISGSGSGNQNLIGSTFSANSVLHLKLFTYTQGLAFIPAYNQPRAYSANETNIFAFPAYKNIAFSLGSNDSYLNDPPSSEPPTRRNSFQFTMGLTYAIQSKY